MQRRIRRELTKREQTMTDKIATDLEEINGVCFEPNETVPFTGKLITKFENGQKEQEISFKDGKQNGLTTSFFENGRKQEEGNYIDGKLNGLVTIWFENGKKQEETNYKD